MGSMNPGNRICSAAGQQEEDRLVPIPTGPAFAGLTWEIR